MSVADYTEFFRVVLVRIVALLNIDENHESGYNSKQNGAAQKST